MHRLLVGFWLILHYCWGASISNTRAEFVQNAEMARTCHDLVYYPKYLDQIIEPIKSCLNYTEDNRIIIPDTEVEEVDGAAVVIAEDNDSGLTVLETLQQLVKYIYLEFHIHRLKSDQENQMYRCSWVKLELVKEDGHVNKTTYRDLFSNETEPLSSELLKQLQECPDNITVPEFRLCMETVCIDYLENSWFAPTVAITTTTVGTTVTTETTTLPTGTNTESNSTTVNTLDETTVTVYNETANMLDGKTTAVTENPTTISELVTNLQVVESQTQTSYLRTTLTQLLQKSETPKKDPSQDTTMLPDKEMLLDQEATMTQDEESASLQHQQSTMGADKEIAMFLDQGSTMLPDQESAILPDEQETEVPATMPDIISTVKSNRNVNTVTIEQLTEVPATLPDELPTLLQGQQTRVVKMEPVTQTPLMVPNQESTTLQIQPATRKTSNKENVAAPNTHKTENHTSMDKATTHEEEV